MFLQIAHASHGICALQPILPSVSGCRGATGLAICSGVSKPGLRCWNRKSQNKITRADVRKDGGRTRREREAGGGRADGPLITEDGVHVCRNIQVSSFTFPSVLTRKQNWLQFARVPLLVKDATFLSAASDWQPDSEWRAVCLSLQLVLLTLPCLRYWQRVTKKNPLRVFWHGSSPPHPAP